jgi:rhodanese-related sulfurtransferase
MPPGSITPEQCEIELDGVDPPHLLDVREQHEVDFVKLNEAVHIPLGELEARGEELSAWRDSRVVVYCHHGIRSQYGAAILEGLGYTRTLNLVGGIDRWAREVDSSLPLY